MNGTLAAFGATGLYYIGFAIFKVAADRMEPVRGHRIHHMAWVILRSWIFLSGLVLVLCGLSLQIIALGELALSVAVPIFVSGLVPLLLIALVVFGERLTPREWTSLLLIAAAMLLIALSIGTPAPITVDGVEPWKLAAVAVPPLALPLVLMAFGDHRPDGRHARPVTGIAYGMSAGFPIGTAELAIKGWGDSTTTGLGILETPYPYLTVLAAALGFGIIIVGFQRCRVSVVATVMTISAKTYLLIMGTILYGEPWPDEAGPAALRVLALALAVSAVLLFPRHDDLAAQAQSPEHDGGDAPEPQRPQSPPPYAMESLLAPASEPQPPRTHSPEPQFLQAPVPQAPDPQAPELRRPYRRAAEPGPPHTPESHRAQAPGPREPQVPERPYEPGPGPSPAPEPQFLQAPEPQMPETTRPPSPEPRRSPEPEFRRSTASGSWRTQAPELKRPQRPQPPRPGTPEHGPPPAAAPERAQTPGPGPSPAPEPGPARTPGPAPESQWFQTPGPREPQAPERRPEPEQSPKPGRPLAAENGRPHTPKYGRSTSVEHGARGEEPS